jgi:putative transposase
VKQLEAARSVKAIAREMGVTDQTLYNWKAKYSGMDVSEARRAGRREPAPEATGGRSKSG